LFYFKIGFRMIGTILTGALPLRPRHLTSRLGASGRGPDTTMVRLELRKPERSERGFREIRLHY